MGRLRLALHPAKCCPLLPDSHITLKMKKKELRWLGENITRYVALIKSDLHAFFGNVETRLDKFYYDQKKLEDRVSKLEKR